MWLISQAQVHGVDVVVVEVVVVWTVVDVGAPVVDAVVGAVVGTVAVGQQLMLGHSTPSCSVTAW